MKRNQIQSGAILSYIQMALNVIISLIVTPIMIRSLGDSEYGLYNTVASTISMLSIISLGFNSSYIRFFSKYKRDGDEEKISSLNGLFLIIFSIMGLVAFLCGIFLTYNLELVFDKGLTASEYGIARILMGMLTVNLSLTFPASVFTSIISSHERYFFLKLISVLNTVVSPLLTLPLLLLGYGSVMMVTVAIIINAVTYTLYIVYVFCVLKCKFKFSGFERGLIGNLFGYTVFIAMNMIIDQINWNVDKIVLGRFKGTGEVALYSVGFTIYSFYQLFSTAISELFTPQIHRTVNSENDKTALRNEFTTLFIFVGRIQFLILALISSGFVFFGLPFVRYWAGAGYTTSYYVALMLILSATVPLIQNLGIEIQRAQNKHKFRSYAYLSMAIINLVVSIFLCQLYGAIGSTIGTAISLVLMNGIVMNIYYHKKCNVDIVAFWKQILRLSVGLIPSIAYGVILNYFVVFDSFGKFVLGVLSYALVYIVSMWFVGMNTVEKNMIKDILKKVTKRYDRNKEQV